MSVFAALFTEPISNPDLKSFATLNGWNLLLFMPMCFNAVMDLCIPAGPKMYNGVCYATKRGKGPNIPAQGCLLS